MFMERAQSAVARAERELAARRRALARVTAADDRDDAVDYIDVVDCALAVQAAEAVVSVHAPRA
jgi:hypothetical protein